jgi:predicted DNA-binding transcriptional regulator AlpA
MSLPLSTPTASPAGPFAPLDHLPPGGERLLTEKEAAQLLGLQPSTLRRWRSTGQPGQPEFVKIAGRAIRYRMSNLAAYIEALPTSGGVR